MGRVGTHVDPGLKAVQLVGLDGGPDVEVTQSWQGDQRTPQRRGRDRLGG